MQRITHYIQEDDGTISAVIRNVELSSKDLMILDNGLDVEVECKPIDPYKITDKQRKKIFALCNDIEAHTGEPRDYMRYMFMDYVSVLYGYDMTLSLSGCTRSQAKQVIEVIIDWVFYNDIPLNYKTSDLMKEDKTFLYWSTVNRNCVICGEPSSDIAHHYAIGRGKNRKTMNHYGYEVLALCREHHSEQHNIGVDTFDKKYHLENSWISVDDWLNKMLKE
ncbi:putative HNHc nuclease [Staphylococcus pettenkoferi]|uniref:putative HNHc nuclease n=1 Tax=Staphylococcus pettenkoferi TaxID=170573 RepID=UPI00119FC57B|nr:putative HNHc nuclease [Staphylococcus pettenkoferi]